MFALNIKHIVVLGTSQKIRKQNYAGMDGQILKGRRENINPDMYIMPHDA